ncbi:MAG: hypothetical protein HY897_11980 [Deltaproteobacteria bacterium]|nr:hypothetical protein [Deltaproteobacteria bacterium]
MKRATVLAAAWAAAAACGDPGSLTGDISLRWAFDNAATCKDAKVEFVQVVVVRAESGLEEFDETLDCTDGSVVVTDFFPGSYHVVLNGLDGGGYLRYQGTAAADVIPGGVNLGTTTLGYVLGDVTFFWSFGGLEDCKTAGVSTVQMVILDSLDQTVFNTNASCDEHGATITEFVRGDYTLVLYGLDVAGARLYETRVPLPINVGANDYGLIDLASSVETGIVSFTWTFDGGSDCASAGVSRVEIVLVSPGGLTVFSDTPECAAGGYTISNLQPGYYDLRLSGRDSEGVSRFFAGPIRVEVVLGNNNLGNFDLSRL